MSAEIHLDNVQNAIVGSTIATEGGDVLVNGQKVTNYYYSSAYQDLMKQWENLQARFDQTRQKIEKYPDDQDFQVELLKIGEERQEVQGKLDELKQEVIRLAEMFTKIPLNTERLRLARQNFANGDYAAARAILDAEQMSGELDALLRQKEQLQQQQRENEDHLVDKANEFLILAKLTAIDFTLPNRFQQACRHFEHSLKAAHTAENTFAYAYFLGENKQFTAAKRWYEEALTLCRSLAEAHPEAYLPNVAATLNNLGNLQRDQHDFAAAAAAYQEALALYHPLAEVHPEAYLPAVATTLNNLGILQSNRHDFTAAAAAFQQALAIRRSLAAAHPEAYLPNVAATLNNLGNLQSDRHDFTAAAAAFQEALALYRTLAEGHPEAYLPDVAMTLNNLGILHSDRHDFAAAAAAYQEALALYRTLAEAHPEAYLPNVAAAAAYQEALALYRTLAEPHPEAYLPDVAMTLNNLGILQRGQHDFAAAAAYQEALALYRTLAEAHPEAYLPNVATTLNNLGNLQRDQHDFAAAAAYQEALAIRRILAEAHPETYLPNVAVTAVNLSLFYLQAVPDKEKSLAYAKEALVSALPLIEFLPAAQDSVTLALRVAGAWGLDAEAFLDEAKN